MPSTPLILNEWVIHDLRGDNGKQQQSETFRFLGQVELKCDHLVLLRGSQWMKKAYKLMKETEPRLRLVSKFLHRVFILNPLKSTILNPNEVPALPDELQAIVPADDWYLIALHKAVPRSIIVTSDLRLVQAVSNFPNVTICLRDEFLKEYLIKAVNVSAIA